MPRPSRRSTSEPLQFSASEYQLRLDHPTLGPIAVDPQIVHRLTHTPGRFFCHGMFLYYGLVHNFSVRLTASELAWSRWAKRWCREGGDPPEPRKAEERELWAPLAPLGDVAAPSHRVFTSSRLLVARLVVHEIPYRLVQEMDDDFAEAFSDDEEREEYEVIDTLRATDDGFSLRHPLRDGGSLLILREFEVHPAFAGQLIGARLIAHVAWELTRHSGDLLYLGAYPWRRLFTHDPRKPARSAAEVRELVRYYERLGFHRAEPEKRITGRSHVRLYRHVGAFGWPVDGLGWLSENAGRQRVEPISDDVD